jgi:ribonuclease PH
MEEEKRMDGRNAKQIRPINIRYDFLGYSRASVWYETGQTKVLVSITLQKKIPVFLRGKNTGWLTAEYSMLPCATRNRTVRESNLSQRNSRSVEISRLIGRCLRSTVDLSLISEKTIMVDCDVLQADGGTRVACITASSLALMLAQQRWIDSGIIDKNIVSEQIAAVSIGLVNGMVYSDLSYQEDKVAEVDFNFVLTKNEKLVEIQGTAEKHPISLEVFEKIKLYAIDGVSQIFNILSETPNISEDINEKLLGDTFLHSRQFKSQAFCIQNRINK